MMAGVTIAFSSAPLYDTYAAAQATLTQGVPFGLDVLEDQMIGGAIIWVIGSLVYVSSIILVLNSLFRREGSEVPQPLWNWDADEKIIMPGLEHRLRDEPGE